MEDDGLGNQFFLNMSGPLDAPVYRYDREAAKEHRRNAIDEEKARLLNALKGDSDGPAGGTETSDPDIEPEEKAPLLGRKTEENGAPEQARQLAEPRRRRLPLSHGAA